MFNKTKITLGTKNWSRCVFYFFYFLLSAGQKSTRKFRTTNRVCFHPNSTWCDRLLTGDIVANLDNLDLYRWLWNSKHINVVTTTEKYKKNASLLLLLLPVNTIVTTIATTLTTTTTKSTAKLKQLIMKHLNL